ncbi:MAG: pyridoxal-phosphate dependent enzyme [Eubacteriaceae bacterium]|nr:pyridoxal-phosphate dependent enzyme [Eubacteriaceae bacterium]
MVFKNSALDLVGETPILRLSKTEAARGIPAELFAKLEFYNPFAAMQDRIAIAIGKEAEELNATSQTMLYAWGYGDCILSLAFYAAICGNPFHLVMPDTDNPSNIELASYYAAEVELVYMASAESGLSYAKSLAEEDSNGVFIDLGKLKEQTHYFSTAPEIWRDTNGEIDVLVAHLTYADDLSGMYQFFKDQERNVRVFGATYEELYEEAIDQTIEDCFDELISIDIDEVYEEQDILARTEGLMLGLSSVAAICAALELAAKPEFAGSKIVCLLSEGGYMRFLDMQY